MLRPFTGAYPLSYFTGLTSLFAGIDLFFEFVQLIMTNADRIITMNFIIFYFCKGIDWNSAGALK
jgi:hypothetical protein